MYFEIAITIIVVTYIFETYLEYRQFKYVSKTKDEPPKHIQKFEPPLVKDLFTYKKSQLYSLSKMRYSFIKGFYDLIETFIFLKFGLITQVWNFSETIVEKYIYTQGDLIGTSVLHEILTTCVFTILTSIFSTITSIPWSLYYNFVLEAFYGFNKMTLRLFVKDTIISFFLNLVIILPLLSIIIKVIRSTGTYFYIYVWLIALVFSFIMLTIYPVLIQPLFNKVQPLEEGSLRTKIEKLAASVKFPLKKLFVIDGSKRSGHSNAYMYGFFNNKRIVLYDTLIEHNSEEETVAVLAHELGHWKKWHTFISFIIGQVQTISILYIFGFIMHVDELYQSFGFKNKPIVVGLFLFSLLFNPIDQVIDFFLNIFSRKNEYEADAFAVDLGYGEHLISGLIKLNAENLGNLTPDWLYSAYYYSHPPMVERLQAITDRMNKNK